MLGVTQSLGVVCLGMAECCGSTTLGSRKRTSTSLNEPDKKKAPAEKTCCFKECSEGPINPETCSSVEVKATLSRGLKKKQIDLAVAWSSNGEAVFHDQCWRSLLKSARARSKKPSVKLANEEREMIKEANKTAEYHDSADQLRRSAMKIGDLILNAKHCVVFTGAGISTSAGIGDYRGKDGKWTELDRQTSSTALDDDDNGVPYEDLMPTYTHTALTKLVQDGHIQYVITQNGDGLHRKAGLPADKQSELHGNVFHEKCETCGKSYYRSFYVLDDDLSQYYEDISDNGSTDILKPPHAVQCPQCKLSHRTGRKCEEVGCHGYLKDSIINFGDDLEEDVLRRAESEASKSDLFISLGSTMQVTPASYLVTMGAPPLRLIIINRQTTGFDHYCTKKHEGEELGVRVYGDCDNVLELVMEYMDKRNREIKAV